MTGLQKFNGFLNAINLAGYRKKYSHIKLVELDLDRNIQALHHLYREYWDNRDTYPDFDEFYGIYSSELARELEEFRALKMFSKETFSLGLPARIYRTWASLLTQIQGGYVAEEIYGRGNVEMSAELDYKGIDMRIHMSGEHINIQIKKDTVSREVRAPWPKSSRGHDIIVVTYEVPGRHTPFTATGKPSIPFGRWQEKWDGKLERLENGFIIFKAGMFALDYIRTP